MPRARHTKSTRQLVLMAMPSNGPVTFPESLMTLCTTVKIQNRFMTVVDGTDGQDIRNWRGTT